MMVQMSDKSTKGTINKYPPISIHPLIFYFSKAQLKVFKGQPNFKLIEFKKTKSIVYLD